jgi:hypothetical protein
LGRYWSQPKVPGLIDQLTKSGIRRAKVAQGQIGIEAQSVGARRGYIECGQSHDKNITINGKLRVRPKDGAGW